VLLGDGEGSAPLLSSAIINYPPECKVVLNFSGSDPSASWNDIEVCHRDLLLEFRMAH
jgi:hypothetical protein